MDQFQHLDEQSDSRPDDGQTKATLALLAERDRELLELRKQLQAKETLFVKVRSEIEELYEMVWAVTA